MPLDQTLKTTAAFKLKNKTKQKTTALKPVLSLLTFQADFLPQPHFLFIYLFLTCGCAELSSANLLANFLCTFICKWSWPLKVLSPSRHLIQVQHLDSPICSLDIAGIEHVSAIFTRISLHLLMYRGAS